MLRNYLVIALRNFLRQKVFTIINVMGLAVGMACSILILLWVSHELSYDRFNERSDRLYRVVQTQHYVTAPLTTTCMPGPIARDLKEEVPEIANSFMFYVVQGIVTYEQKSFSELVRIVDPTLFSMFSFDFIQGDQENVFQEPNSVVITDKMAMKYFGEENPLGKVITVNNEHRFKVTGIIRDTPLNSSFRFDLCIPFENMEAFGFQTDRYGWNSYYSYVEVPEGVDYRDVNVKIKDFLMNKTRDLDQEVDDRSEAPIELYLFPLEKIHLYSVTGKGGDIQYVYIFTAIAIFILVIACINFMNLSTARAFRRSREIGLRKVVGAEKKQIIFQFMSESLMVTFVAFILSVVLVYLFLPGFNLLADKELEMDWLDGRILGGLAAIFLFVGLLSGSYPAFYLSGFRPIEVLKNISGHGGKKADFRRVLVVFQFSIAIVLIICTLVVQRQLSYIHTKKLGMDLEDVVYISMRGKTNDSYPALKNEFIQDPGVISVTRASNFPFDIGSNSSGFDWEGRETTDESLIGFTSVDVDYLEATGIRLDEGRFFDASFSTDTISAMVINRKAARLMGMDDPVGRWVSWGDNKYTIIGVLDDFHFLPMNYEIDPLVMLNAPQFSRIIIARINDRGVGKSIETMRRAWERINPGFPFEYGFLKEAYSALYTSEARLSRIFRYFTILTIFISCLGLFGLAAYMAEQRTREIGIRKVMGAEVQGLVIKLSAEFIKWVVIANLLAIPVAYVLMDRWLDGYEYHASLSVWLFLGAVMTSLVIALMTVIVQTIRAASKSPATSLKYE